MLWRAPTGYGPLQRGLAWAGLILMLASFGWLQLLPPSERVQISSDDGWDRGPVRLVVIDAGHGGRDSGAIRDGVIEKDLTIDVARRLEQLLRARGFRTVLTRSGDEAVSLAERTAIANEQRNCVFVSIHFDEGGRAAATGVNTYYAARQQTAEPGITSWLPFLQPVSNESTNVASQSLAGFVQQALVTRTGAVDRGTRAQQFYVIANVRHPAVLVEGGFLTNQEDLSKLTREEYRQELAAAISDGIKHYSEVVRERPTVAAVPEPGT